MTATSMKVIKGFSSAVILATVLVAGASVSQAADSNDRIVPPSPAEVAILRGLLALQHPSLRQIGTASASPAVPAPTVATEPGQPAGEASSS